MRSLGLCEERGGGLDKTLLEIERQHLPAPEFVSSENSMRVILFGPRPFNAMTKSEKVRACFYHCVLRWLTHDYMSNSSLRDRFSLSQDDYQAASAVIAEAIRLGRIAPADPNQGKRNARYIPYWAAWGLAFGQRPCFRPIWRRVAAAPIGSAASTFEHCLEWF